jgi:hypothetical protein
MPRERRYGMTRWPESVAVGTLEFVEQTKERRGPQARERDAIEAGDSFGLWEPGAAYTSDLAGKSAGLRIESTYCWNSYTAYQKVD